MPSERMPIDSLIVDGALSVGPRASLVRCPELRHQGEPVVIEVRPVTLADRLRYVGALAALEDEMTGTGGSRPYALLHAMLVIPSCWSPTFDDAGVWQPGESTLRVFRPDDEALVGALPPAMVARLVDEAARLSGLSKAESVAAQWRYALDGEWGLAMHIANEWGMSLADLNRRMPSYELTWWRAFFNMRAQEQEMASSRSSSSSAGSADGFA